MRALAAHYEREIYPVLTPLAIGPGQPFPYISGLSLSLGVFVRDPENGEERLARVKVPEGMSRFVTVGRDKVMFPLEEVIAHFLPRLFPGMEVVESAPFRVTRDADFEVSDDADDLLQAVQVELRRRRFGDVVRLEVAHNMSARMLRRLVDSLDVADRQVFRIHGMLDLADVSQLADIDRPELKFESTVGVVPPAFVDGDRKEMFAAIAAGDILIHLPYDSFAGTVEEFINAGARDPDSVALKTTVYRTSERSPLIPALIRAAEEGKQSVCVVELKARFDESRNIHWSRALEEAGTHVAYGFPHLKVHAKTTLIVRREGRGLRRYAHIGTGNYHAITARVYEDFGLFTSDDDITADVADLFNLLTGFGRPQTFRKLLVAPYTLRPRLLELFASVADAARAGQRARIRIKVNNFTDVEIIDALYDASRAGAQVDIVSRGVCALRPGVEGMSETIRVRSVLGRWLEHSRAFIIEAGDVVDIPAGQRRPHAAQPGRPLRGAGAGRGRRGPRPDRRDVRPPVRDRRLLVAAAAGRELGAASRRRHGRRAARPDPARPPPRHPGGAAVSRVAAEVDALLLPPDRDSRPAGQTPRMTVAVIDIGSNTGRLLVARRGNSAAVVALRNERTVLGLGHEIESTGTISAEKLEQTMACARRYATLARAHGAAHIDVIVTAPGRQSANADALVAGLSHATGVAARVLSAHDEGCYAFEGATAGLTGLDLPVGVCDVGGGSTELAVGSPRPPARRPDLDRHRLAAAHQPVPVRRPAVAPRHRAGRRRGA